MTNSIGGQMLAAYDKSRARADRMRKRYGKEPAFVDVEELELQVRNSFLSGVHTAFSQEIIASLRRNLGAQQQVADALGLKDRTSISQMLRSGTMDGIRITAALYQFGHHITLPTRERAALYGFARATSFIKTQVQQDHPIECSMTPQEFAYLVGMLASDEWDMAIRDTDPAVAREVAVKIVDEREIATVRKGKPYKYRPEQYVLMLKELHDVWGDYAALALCVIPDCIPTGDSGTEATL